MFLLILVNNQSENECDCRQFLEKKFKKKSVSLTILQKVEILKLLDQGSTAKYVANRYGIGNRTVYDIRDNREKILQFYAKTDSTKGIVNRKRMREAQSADLDDVLFEWFRQRGSENVPITGQYYVKSCTQVENLDEKNILEFLETDEPQIVHNLTDAEIISSVLNQEENNSETESNAEEEGAKVSVSEGISLGNQYLKFLETQDCVTDEELLSIHRLQEKLSAKKIQILKQSKIDSLFNKQT